MKLIALYDRQGIILAAVESTEGQYGVHKGPVPVATGDNKVGTFEVPQSLARGGLADICTSLRVDVARNSLVEPSGR
jgi:hypothetical protein